MEVDVLVGGVPQNSIIGKTLIKMCSISKYLTYNYEHLTLPVITYIPLILI